MNPKGWIRLVLCSLALFHVLGPAPVRAQQDSLPDDTFGDPNVAALIGRAIAARGRDVSGIRSYEGLMREHLYVGLTARGFRRERGLFEQERVARLRWSADGERAIQWIGARQAIPVFGADTRRRAAAAAGKAKETGEQMQHELRDQLPDELLNDAELPAFAFDPGGDRLVFGGDWALHPLADSALADYRYFSGDTLRISLPSENRQVVLYEVKVEPRRADFHLVAGSLWFDAETASLVRATYRPARPFDLSLDEPEDAGDVPGILKPVQAEISYVTVEYSLQEFKYWLPRRFALAGEVRLGGFVRMPLTVDWTVRDYRVNEARSEIPALTGPLPRGWSRRERRIEGDDGKPRYVTVIVPRGDSLVESPALSEDFGERAPTAFTDAEIRQLRGELESLLPTYRRFRPRFAWGLQRGMLRYNRVEGLSVGATATVPFSPATSMTLEARVGTASRTLDGTAELARGTEDRRWSLEGYRRLESMADWSNPFSFGSSLDALLLGEDRGQYYRATGAGLGYHRTGRSVRSDVEVFHERQQPVGLGTDFFLLQGVRDFAPPEVLSARDVTLTGGRVSLGWFSGIDPDGLVATGRVLAEAAGGDASYERLALTASVSHPLPFGLAGALELGGGTTWGDDLLQRQFFLGGSATLRGFWANSIHGPTFWRARAEMANRFAGARVGLFADAGWAGTRDAIRLDDARLSAGVGASFLDGLIRFDIARALRGGSTWRAYLYLDGLL